ncbi:hypothetical protein PIB30_032426 [Stylosanthes scabra]|uniref:Uncharacterized protein n=1 Tax=Stylosanthes scabra TaxID=79078 RepID=A0ABU6Z9T2_9FABA|nr:hypothetical protein [Stylosanthes scabra]
MHSQPPFTLFDENNIRELQMILGSDDGDHLQAFFSHPQVETQPQLVVMPGRAYIDCLRPPCATTSGGHCQGCASVDSWISGGDHQRGPIITQHAIDFNESTAEGEGSTEGDNNSGVVESQQQVEPSGSSDDPPYNLWNTKEKKKPSKWSPSPWVRMAKNVVTRKK